MPEPALRYGRIGSPTGVVIEDADGTDAVDTSEAGVVKVLPLGGPNGYVGVRDPIDAQTEQFAGAMRPGLMAFYNGDDDGVGKYAIGLAHSIDGVTWARDPRNPILERDSGTAWESDHVKEPNALIVDNKVFLYYVGYNGTAYQIGLAYSTDYGKTFTKYSGNPVLTLGSSGAWDDAVVRFPCVMYDPDDVAGKRFKMWYAGEATKDAKPGKIGYAYSADGFTWTKSASNPLLSVGSASAWDDFAVYPGSVLKVDGTYYLYYGGRNETSGFWQVGLATFTDPEGTYTKNASNPLVARDSTAAASLTADTLTDATTVTVADTSVFTAREYVLIRDDNTASKLNRIESIDSATTMTLRDAVANDFTTAQNATIRSAYYASVFPASIWREGGEWVMCITAFQQYQDAGELRELGAFATSSTLTGAFAIDYARGLVLEYDTTISTWDVASAENFNIHPALYSPALDTVQHQWVERDANDYPILREKATPPLVSVRRTATQSIATATDTAVIWQASIVGYGDMWDASTNPERITIDAPGTYDIRATVAFAANATGARVLKIRVNGTTDIDGDRSDSPSGSQATLLHVSRVYPLVAGDYVEIVANQSSGGALDIAFDTHRAPHVSVARIGGV